MEDTQKQQPEIETKKEVTKDSKQTQTTKNIPEKDWWEQLLGTAEQDGIKNIYKLLTHPLALVIVVALVFHWLLKQKRTDNGISTENEELREELAFMKKKYKKLKKRWNRMAQETGDYSSEEPKQPVKRPLVLVD